jgi:hypothetical protein
VFPKLRRAAPPSRLGPRRDLRRIAGLRPSPPVRVLDGPARQERQPAEGGGHQHCSRHDHADSRRRHNTRYAANLMSLTPKSAWGWVKALLHSVYNQPDAESVHAQSILTACPEPDRHREHRTRGGDPDGHHRLESNPRARGSRLRQHAA